MSCNSTSVYEGESALISCFLFTLSFTSLNLSREESAIASVVSNGTELVSPAYQGKFDVLYTSSSPRVDITIHSMSCFDQATYTVKMYLGTGNVTSTTFRVIMKGFSCSFCFQLALNYILRFIRMIFHTNEFYKIINYINLNMCRISNLNTICYHLF